mmetsp:Transcript_43760/g.127364  ORF Transcript_43760/g.127364 Transcript_43760/m.127364 type:complete len:129 (-) Transcript_43760:29-415(-)
MLCALRSRMPPSLGGRFTAVAAPAVVGTGLAQPSLLSPSALTCTPPAAGQARSTSSIINSRSLLEQYYRKLPIRKKFRRAMMRGTMVMCDRTGQVKIPPIAISGYDEKKNPYRGRFEDLRSPRVWLKD